MKKSQLLEQGVIDEEDKRRWSGRSSELGISRVWVADSSEKEYIPEAFYSRRWLYVKSELLEVDESWLLKVSEDLWQSTIGQLKSMGNWFSSSWEWLKNGNVWIWREVQQAVGRKRSFRKHKFCWNPSKAHRKVGRGTLVTRQTGEQLGKVTKVVSTLSSHTNVNWNLLYFTRVYGSAHTTSEFYIILPDFFPLSSVRQEAASPCHTKWSVSSLVTLLNFRPLTVVSVTITVEQSFNRPEIPQP